MQKVNCNTKPLARDKIKTNQLNYEHLAMAESFPRSSFTFISLAREKTAWRNLSIS